MNRPEFFPGMVPLRCQSCGGEVGRRSPGPAPDPAIVTVRCTACAAVEEAEAITAAAADQGSGS